MSFDDTESGFLFTLLPFAGPFTLRIERNLGLFV